MLTPSININPGNYCYPLKENYLVSKEKNFFYRYYGEEKIEEVTKKIKSIPIELVNEIPDDLLSNLMFLSLLSVFPDIKELKNEIINLFGLKKVTSRTINKRIKKLFDRYHLLVKSNKNIFYHMSCGANEPKEYENLIGTNKQLFCALCWIYDCHLHQQPESSFDSPQCYNVKEYLKTYRTINEASFKVIKEYYPNLEEGLQQNELFNKINSNCEKYNSIIQDYKLGHFSGYINLFEDKNSINTSINNIISQINGTSTEIGPQETPSDCCTEFCYKNFLKLSNETKLKICKQMKGPLPNIYELYLVKLVQIFKYDPCAISKAMKLITLDDQTDSSSIIECYVIYLRLISEDYLITKPLTKEVIDIFSKEKTNDRKKFIESHRLKIIKENAKNSMILYIIQL